MANDLTELNKEYWRAEMQVIFFRESMALEVAALDLRDILADGDKINHVYMTHPTAVTYTKGSAITNKNVFTGTETLSVSTAKVAPIYVDSIDRLQNHWDVQAEHARRSQRVLNNILDQYVNYLGKANATSYIDAGHVGGTAGSNIVVSVSNIDQMMTAIDTKLNELDIPQAGRFALFGPRMKAILNRYIGGKETDMGDIIGQNGRLINRFGFELFYSNNNYFTASLGMAAAPAAAEYVTINGAILQFAADADAPSTTAAIGVLRSATATVDVTNLTYAINGSGGTEGTEWGDNDAVNWKARWKLIKCGAAATDNTTSVGLVAYGDVVVSENLADASDVWSSQTSNVLCGLKKAVSICTQKTAEIEVKPVYNLLGNNIFVWNLYGGTVWQDMTDALVYAKIDASSWT